MFIDIDEIIVLTENRTVNDIFSQSGEAYFRKLEKEALKELSQQEIKVVSCGGGIVIDPDNIAIMKNSGIVVALTARPEVILERTKKDTPMPLLNVDGPLVKINELLTDRNPSMKERIS